MLVHESSATNIPSEAVAARDVTAVLAPKGTLQDDIYYLRGQIAALYIIYGRFINLSTSDTERASLKKDLDNGFAQVCWQKRTPSCAKNSALLKQTINQQRSVCVCDRTKGP